MAHSPTKTMIRIMMIFIIGGIGGVVFERFVVPKIATIPWVERFAFLRQATEHVTIVTKTQEVVVKEEDTVRGVIEQVRGGVVQVVAQTPSRGGEVRTTSTGMIMTGDGVIVTPATIIAQNPHATYGVITADRTFHQATVTTVDPLTQLAFLHVDDLQDTTVLSSARIEDLSVGQRITAIEADPLRDGMVVAAPTRIAGIGPMASSGTTEQWQDTVFTAMPVMASALMITDRGELAGIAIGDRAETTTAVIPVSGIHAAFLHLTNVEKTDSSSTYNTNLWGIEYALVSSETAEVDLHDAVHVTSVISGSRADRAGVKVGDYIERIGEKKPSLRTSLTTLLTEIGARETTVYIRRDGQEQAVSFPPVI